MGVQGKQKGVNMISEIKKYQARGLNLSQISRALKVSRNTVRKYLRVSDPSSLDKKKTYQAPWSTKVDWPHVLREQSAGVQLSHYFEQNIEGQIEGISYLSFWREFRRRHPKIKLDMHQVFPPGERCEFDYKGKASEFGYILGDTGEFVPCRLFGMVLPSSQLFFARATLTERQDDVFASIARGFKYFGGTTSTVVFDNAKAQVTKANKYDPEINSEFSLFCDSYDIAPIPARPSRPKDKSLIENSLGVFWRWAWPQLRKMQFFSLAELNAELRGLLEIFNKRVQKKYGMSRREKFETFERAKLKVLSRETYESGIWKKVKVHPDCHVQVSHNFYSVPYKYRGQELNARLSRQTLEIFSGLERVAIHQMPLVNRGVYVTTRIHLPESHQALLERTPQSLIAEAKKFGLNTHRIAERLINEARHPLMHLRRLQGIIRLTKRHSIAALEEACSFFVDAPLTDIRVNSIERVINAKSKRPESKKVKRQPNENLRGQLHWAETYH